MSKLDVMNYEERTSTDKYWYQRVKLLQAGILMKRLHSKKLEIQLIHTRNFKGKNN